MLNGSDVRFPEVPSQQALPDWSTLGAGIRRAALVAATVQLTDPVNRVASDGLKPTQIEATGSEPPVWCLE